MCINEELFNDIHLTIGHHGVRIPVWINELNKKYKNIGNKIMNIMLFLNLCKYILSKKALLHRKVLL